MVLSSDQVNAMISSQVASMGNMGAYAGQIGPYGQMGGGFASIQQPMAPGTGFTPPIGGGLAQLAGGYAGMQQALPGSAQGRAAAEQMGMGAAGMLMGPQSPLPFSMLYQGMQQQYNLNRAMESQFDFLRAGGPGRGFSGTQQLAVGAGFRQIAGQTPGLEMPELTGLMTAGAQQGQYQGVRDTVGMIKRTRELLKSWQQIATELGTTLQEAQQIQGQLRQIGVFQPGRQAQVVQQMATTAAISGVGVQQQLAAGAMGAQMAPRLFGQGVGVRAAGAGAMQQQLTMLSTAGRAGLISEQQIFEATGRYGVEGRMAMAQSMNVAGARFMRRGRGRVTLAAFVDPDSMQMDQEALGRFMSGNMNLGEVERRAKQNASKMGYVKWRANRGRMAAEFTQETSGLGHLALMRAFLGEGAMEDTERARVILAKQTGMSQSEIDAVMPMLRELPQLQSRIRAETRVAGRQRERAQAYAEYGPQAMADKQRQKIKSAIMGPLEDARGQIMRGFMEAFEETVDEAIGEYQVTVSQSTKQIYQDMMRGGAGAQKAQARLATMPGGLTGAQRQFMAGAELRGGPAPGTGLSARGLFERPGAAYATVAAGLGAGGARLAGRLGEFLGGQTVEGLMKATPRFANQEMAAAVARGEITADMLQMPAGNFNTLMGDDRIANILAGGGDFASKMDAVKKHAAGRNFDLTDDQAKALMTGISRQKGFLEDINIAGPMGKQPTNIKELQEFSDAYIKTVFQPGKSSVAGADLSPELEETARAWLADDEIMTMVEQGKSVAEIKARAMEKFKDPAAAEFYDRALTGKGRTAEEREASAKKMRSAFLQGGRAQFGAEFRQHLKNAYASDLEDITVARNKGQFIEALKGGTTEQQNLFRRYEAALGQIEKDPIRAMEEMQEVNRLALTGDDPSKMVAMARKAGLTELANTWEGAAGKARDIRTAPIKKGRLATARLLLGDRAGEYEDILGKRGISEQERFELLSAEVGKAGDAGLAGQIAKIGKATKDELGDMTITRMADLHRAQSQMNKEQEEVTREREEDAHHRNQAIIDTARNTEKIATSLADKGGLKVTIKNVGEFLTKKGEEDVG